jgi:hypothetical protein
VENPKKPPWRPAHLLLKLLLPLPKLLLPPLKLPLPPLKLHPRLKPLLLNKQLQLLSKKAGLTAGFFVSEHWDYTHFTNHHAIKEKTTCASRKSTN